MTSATNEVAPNGVTWHPTVLFLVGLIIAEFAFLAALRLLPIA